jgi:hypothetical protein
MLQSKDVETQSLSHPGMQMGILLVKQQLDCIEVCNIL